MLSSIKPKLEPIIGIIAKPFMRVHPNILTLFGLLPPVLYFYLMVEGHYGWALVALAGSAFDFIDGAVARRTGKVSAFGGVLDSTIDRIADALFISAFGFANLVWWDLVIALIVASFTISYIRSRAELAGGGNFKLDVGIIERSERVVFIVITTIVAMWNTVLSGQILEWLFVVMIVLSMVTIGQRLFVSWKKLG